MSLWEVQRWRLRDLRRRGSGPPEAGGAGAQILRFWRNERGGGEGSRQSTRWGAGTERALVSREGGKERKKKEVKEEGNTGSWEGPEEECEEGPTSPGGGPEEG